MGALPRQKLQQMRVNYDHYSLQKTNLRDLICQNFQLDVEN